MIHVSRWKLVLASPVCRTNVSPAFLLLSGMELFVFFLLLLFVCRNIHTLLKFVLQLWDKIKTLCLCSKMEQVCKKKKKKKYIYIPRHVPQKLKLDPPEMGAESGKSDVRFCQIIKTLFELWSTHVEAVTLLGLFQHLSAFSPLSFRLILGKGSFSKQSACSLFFIFV